MRKMKDSGIEWIGMIPKDWSITKIKFLLSNENDSLKVGPFGSQLSGSDFVAEGYWVYSQRVVLDKNFEHNSMLVTKEKFDTMSAFRVREKDILITTRGTIGKICRVPKKFSEGILHPCIIKFRIDEQKYCYKLLELIFNHSGILQKQLNYLSNATTIEVIYSGTLKNLQIPFPPLDEQKKIADFLDEKCGEIDSIRSDILNQIDILNDYKKSVITEAVTKGLNPKAKLKDSGIEWIGKIPEEWTIIPINYLTKSRSGGTPDRNKSQYWEDGTIPWMASGEVNKFLVYDTKEKITELATRLSNAKIVPANSVMVALNGQGKTKGMSAVLKIDAACNQSLCAFQCNPMRLSYMYLLYCFQSMYKFLRFQAGDDVRDGLAASFVKKQRIPLPSLNEQNAITSFIDEKCSAIDATIADKQRQLETLNEYKKSLIFEYVTGKKEVPTQNVGLFLGFLYRKRPVFV